MPATHGQPQEESEAIAAHEAGRAGAAPLTDNAFHGPVVAIGASAGGLDALERLFAALPADLGAAFVVVQHLSPDHKSMMVNLLARHTPMPVTVAAHDETLRPDTVFLIPPGMTMRLAGERLQLDPKPEHGLSLPIDIFFNSAAEHCADRALAVVLSGTGSDGSRGLAAITAGGGLVFVQDPASAKFDGMPRSAIATGFVDVVAPLDALAARIVEQLRHPRAPNLRLASGATVPALVQPLDGVLELLLASSGIDFREYKPSTVLRRIERRMQVLHSASLADYRDHLEASKDEQLLLRRELLIPVTRFFRDADAFEELDRQVVAPLVARGGTEPIRVWVSCCATGEEAYSIAMLFADAFERLGRSLPIKIFATDVEQHYLDIAALGQYPETIAAEVPPAMLARHFVERGGSHAMRAEIRQMVIFARHNLVADPPFTRMDLVCCRNAMIYLQPRAQERALRRLQYALVAGGHLLLGPSESLGPVQRAFRPVAARQRLFQLIRRERFTVTADVSGRHRLASHNLRRGSYGLGGTASADVVEEGQRALLQSYAPTSLLIGENRELLHVYGDARALLQFTDGQATLDVLKLLPRDLSWAASLLLQALATTREAQRSTPLRMPEAAGGGRLQIVARPVDTGDERSLVLLSFEPLAAGTAPEASAELLAHDDQHRRQVETLERELNLTHDRLQAAIEELETSNEELQATNEELMAANEELQSTNEELQSVNEELYTVNSEYQEKVDILNGVNADLENVSRAAAIPTLFVDEQLLLTRFTPEAAQLFKLRDGDVGRSLEDFAHTLDYPQLYDDLRSTLADGRVVEREVRSRGGQWWLARMQPYVSRLPRSGRAVATFFDVTSLKDSQRLQAVIDSLAEHVAVVDGHGTITMVNAAWRRFAVANGDAQLQGCGPGSNYLRICARASHEDADARRAHDGLAAVLSGRAATFSMQYPCHTSDRRLWFLMSVGPVAPPQGGAVVSHFDITPWMPGDTGGAT